MRLVFKTLQKVSLFLIITLAFFLRFWQLDKYPALNADEAAIGYNVYSLIETGKDEHGNPWPIHFQSFNDYKPGLYFYLVLPFVKIFGLNEWSVRAPGAFLGVLTVFLIYLLLKELFPKTKDLSLSNYYPEVGLIAALFLAISPWHIHFSRGGWEVNVATFFITFGALFFIKAVRNRSFVTLLISSIAFVLSLYTYHAARVIVPLLGLGLAFIYKDAIRKNISNFIVVAISTLILLTPLVIDIGKSSVFARAAGVGLFADTGPLARINEQRGEHGDFRSFQSKLLHNKLVNYGLAFFQNWASHFHGEFLFLSGDSIQRNKVPETGQMYMLDLFWLIAGGFWLTKNIKDKNVKLVLFWLVIAPLASSLTFQSPHALRAQNMVIPLTIINALGLSQVIKWSNNFFKKRYLIFSFYLVLIVLITWQFWRYQHMYWVHMAKEYPFSSQYGLKELVSYIGNIENKKILVTDRYDQPYILFLFYLKYPPEKFQVDHVLTARDRFGFSTVKSFDRFEFRQIDWDSDQPNYPNSLIVGTDEEIPEEANIIKEIYGSNGYKYFQIVAN